MTYGKTLTVLAGIVFGLLLIFSLTDPTFLPAFAPKSVSAVIGLMWQVHAGFLAIGFAGLAIASQLHSEPPIAAGVARRALLDQLKLSRVLLSGLVGNLLIGLGAIWLPSDGGAVTLFFLAFLPTVIHMIIAYWRMGDLYSHPSRVEEQIPRTLRDQVHGVVETLSWQSEESDQVMKELTDVGFLTAVPYGGAVRRDIRHPGEALTVDGFNLDKLNYALGLLLAGKPASPSTGQGTVSVSQKGLSSPQIVIHVRPHQRVRAYTLMYSLLTPSGSNLGPDIVEKLTHLLLDAVEYKPTDYVHKETALAHEVSLIQDAASTAFNSGAFKRAERAVDLIRLVMAEGWKAGTIPVGSFARPLLVREWLDEPIFVLEQFAGRSSQAARILVGSATNQCYEAAHEGNFDRFVAGLDSLRRLWARALTSADPDAESMLEHVLVVLQNLAEFGLPDESSMDPYRTECAWTFVNLVKDAWG